MYFRSPLRIASSLSHYCHSGSIVRSCPILNNVNSTSSLLSPLSCQLPSERTFMFWRSNVNRELYGSPTKALATAKHRRLQKSLRQIIRDGQVLRLLKETLLPEWKKWWAQIQPWDRRYCTADRLRSSPRHRFLRRCLDMSFSTTTFLSFTISPITTRSRSGPSAPIWTKASANRPLSSCPVDAVR